MSLSRFVPMFALVFLPACRCAGSSSGGGGAEMQALTKAWCDAARASDWKAVGATYTEDAILLPQDSKEIVGRANIQAFLAAFPPLTDVVTTDVETEVLGDKAYVRGHYSMTIHPPGGAPIVDSGKYIEIRKRTADGSWKIFRDMFSSNAPLGK